MKTTRSIPIPIALTLAIALAAGTGCGSSEPADEGAPVANAVSVPTEEAARAEAERQITKDNFEEELAKLEEELEADENGGP